MANVLESNSSSLATREDIQRVFGDLDVAVVVDIMKLQPTVQDLERASLWLGGDPDVFGPGETLHHPASAIVTILTANEEDESRPS